MNPSGRSVVRARVTSQTDNPTALSLSRRVAPEDLSCGDYVAVLNEVYEYPSFLWCCDTQLTAPSDTVAVRFCALGAGYPLRVKGLCLPFVFVKLPSREHRTLDIRQVELVRLDRDYARGAWRALSGGGGSRKKKRGKKK